MTNSIIEHSVLPPHLRQKEWENKYAEYSGFLLNPETKFKNKKYFFKQQDGQYKATYIIGAQWLKENIESLVITPKIPNIDFIKMFSCCLENGIETDSFSEIYGIDLDAARIKTKVFKSVLSPLLVVHFLACVQKLLKSGLKKDYINQNENLKKVKGHINTNKNERINIINRRYDKIYCSYQEYSINTPQNRLLKKALLFSKKYIRSISNNSSSNEIENIIKKCLNPFITISDDIELHEVKNSKQNSLYKDYTECIRLAKLIIKRFDNSLTQIQDDISEVPPFWIDMSLLYEHYVLGLLKKSYGNNIVYQYASKFHWKPDFIHIGAKTILDTKYMPWQEWNGLTGDMVRQLSGYARIKSIQNILKASENEILRCVIIYPKEDKENTNGKPFCKPLEKYMNKEESGLCKFYKIGVALPTKKHKE